MEKVYDLMHMDRRVACIGTNGKYTVFDASFLPYGLFLDDHEKDFNTLINNMGNFYFWCASRMLTMDRAYAKEILNGIGTEE